MHKVVTFTLIQANAQRKSRKGQLRFISQNLHCTEKVAKQLMFAFLYFAKESRLREILDARGSFKFSK